MSPRVSNCPFSSPQNLNIIPLTFGTLKAFVVALRRRKMYPVLWLDIRAWDWQMRYTGGISIIEQPILLRQPNKTVPYRERYPDPNLRLRVALHFKEGYSKYSAFVRETACNLQEPRLKVSHWGMSQPKPELHDVTRKEFSFC